MHHVSFIADDTVMYKVQAAYCSGRSYIFKCDKPDHVVWVAQGLIWGAKASDVTGRQACLPREGDCKMYEKYNEFLTVSII